MTIWNAFASSQHHGLFFPCCATSFKDTLKHPGLATFSRHRETYVTLHQNPWVLVDFS